MIKKKKTLAVCHDAGGAEVISAYIKENPEIYEWVAYVAGPASEIFRRKGIKTSKISEKNQSWLGDLFAGEKAATVLTSIDWSSPITNQVRREAKRRSLHSIVYLDHWVYYRERLGYPRSDWKGALPDEFWAGDPHSLKLARKLFPHTKVRLEPNLYFEEVKRDFHRYVLANKKNPVAGSLLFISEPIRATSQTFGVADHSAIDEYQALGSLLDFLLGKNLNNRVIVRFHPSEKQDKYDHLLLKYQGKLTIEKSLGKSVYEDLAASYLVVGMESMALVIALLCGKKVVSLLPDCPLPFSEIRKVPAPLVCGVS